MVPQAAGSGTGTAIDVQGLLKSALIGGISGARRRIGFSGKNLKEPAAAIFYNEKLAEFEETGHVIGKNMRLLEKLGLKPDGAGYEFPLVIPETPKCRIAGALERLGRTPEQKVVLCAFVCETIRPWRPSPAPRPLIGGPPRA